MPITFQICIDYNKVFYRNLNKLATAYPCINLQHVELFGLL
jgi:hypothetical protein